MSVKFRPELDGLRTLAVMAVIFYHAKLKIIGHVVLPGGFFGVDIFFVLSGFLITNIVRNSLQNESFSFMSFYIKRIKRIFPALLFVLLTSSFAAYYFLLPSDLVKFSNSLLSAISFTSNIFFYNEDPYTSSASELKPLLHTWSLSVEWQYYIIFPVLLYIFHRILKDKVYLPLIFIFFLSLFYAVYQSNNDISYAFYMLQTRAWELIAGGLCAWIVTKIEKKRTGEIVTAIGLALILFSFFSYSDSILHPSFITLIPVIGACFFIVGSLRGELLSSPFRVKPVVFIGGMSYSLYLWHQPVFAFFRIKNDIITWESFAVLFIISLSLSLISFTYIENVFRRNLQLKYNIAFYVSLIILISSGSIASIKYNGLPSRLTPLARDMYENYSQPEFKRLTGPEGVKLRSNTLSNSCTMRDPLSACRFGDGSVVVLGDSYAGSFTYALKEKLKKEGKGLIALDYEQCPFVSGLWFGNVAECPEVDKRRWQVLDSIKNKNKTTILIATNYTQFTYPKEETLDPISDGRKNITVGTFVESAQAWKSYKKNITRLIDLGFNVVIVYPIPSVTEDVKNKFFNIIKTSNAEISGSYYENDPSGLIQAKEFSNKLDALLADEKKILKIKPVDILCKTGKCEILNKNGALYNVGSHLSFTGVQTVLDSTSL